MFIQLLVEIPSLLQRDYCLRKQALEGEEVGAGQLRSILILVPYICSRFYSVLWRVNLNFLKKPNQTLKPILEA